MTDNEIVKALECCLQEYGNCEDCPYKGYQCVSEKGENVFYKDILDLINRQKAEIERMQDNIQCVMSANVRLINQVGKAKAKAIKEFAERLKMLFEKHCAYTFKCIMSRIDDLVKEMVGDEDV